MNPEHITKALEAMRSGNAVIVVSNTWAKSNTAFRQVAQFDPKFGERTRAKYPYPLVWHESGGRIAFFSARSAGIRGYTANLLFLNDVDDRYVGNVMPCVVAADGRIYRTEAAA